MSTAYVVVEERPKPTATTVRPARRRQTAAPALRRFATIQTLNAIRHVEALRPFHSDEFGTGPASPTEAHIRAANALIDRLRARLLMLANAIGRAADISVRAPTPANLGTLLDRKDQASSWVKEVEKVWDFYFELFGQRQSQYADRLLATDRIALDCYQTIYTGLGVARSIPSPPPFTYMATGFTPSTFRRDVALSRIGKRANPFPIVQLPYHRLVNPWTLGAVHHEVSHNIQSDLGLWQEVPRRVFARLRQAGLPVEIAQTWARWNKEIWADLSGLLLGGPAIIPSLMDVVALAPARAQSYNPSGVHPTPYLRVLINLELLRRMDFPHEAEMYRRLWKTMYPSARLGTIPRAMLDTFPSANALVVDTICFAPYRELGNKVLADVSRFRPMHEAMVREAGERLAIGTDPGIIPERFLVGAARWAVDQRLAPPGRITENFYRALVRR